MPWVKGQSGNALGRPKGRSQSELARYIRTQTKQGCELVDFALSVLRGTAEIRVAKAIENPDGTRTLQAVMVPPPMEDRIDARNWLADRGWGKAVETIELIEDASAGPVDTLAPELLAAQLGPNGAQA
jgi:hypothetical protein